MWDVWEIILWVCASWTVVCCLFLAVAVASMAAWRLISWAWRKSVAGDVVLITGASSGIGAALAHEFASRGAKVILSARNASGLVKVKEGIVKAGCEFTPEIVVMDVADLEAARLKVESAFKIHGRIDIVVNNAGVLNRGEICETDFKVYKETMQVNYFGAVCVTLAALPMMMSAKKGTIVTVSSVQGRFALPRRAAYAASKHAVCAFMDSLRAETAASGIRVTCVHPGYVLTNIAHASLTASGDAYGRPDPNIVSGYEAEYVARRIVDGVEVGESDIVIAPFIPSLLIRLRTLCPPLHFFIMKRIAKSPNYY